jgi:hypothetical protein
LILVSRLGYQYSGVVSERLGSGTVGEDVTGGMDGLMVGDLEVGVVLGEADGEDVTGDFVGDGQWGM